jgi:4,5-dihydroxyphthalate decarboxylase
MLAAKVLPMSTSRTLRLLLQRDELAAAASEAVHETGPELRLERLDIRPANRGFPAFVNDISTDISEIAIVSLLQAVAAGKPVGMLPVTVLGRFQHQTLKSIRGLGLDALPGSTVGVRSWTQTTGAWVRGALADQFGIDWRAIDWVTYEGSHLRGTPDPEGVRRAPDCANLREDLMEGRLDFVIAGEDIPGATPAIEDPDEAAHSWARAAGCVPVNHVVGIALETAGRYPEVMLAVYQALRRASVAPPEDGFNLTPTGFDGLRPAFTKAAVYALEQQILPRPVDFEELVAPTLDALGASAAAVLASA